MLTTDSQFLRPQHYRIRYDRPNVLHVTGGDTVGTMYGGLELAASWRLSPQWTLRGHIDKLTDKSYERFIGFPEPALSARIGVHYSLR